MANPPQLELDKFSGPLELLLNLLHEQKLSITELALSEVTEQYLRYLDTLEKNRAEELADFLVVGSKLLWLKSKALLPQVSPDEEEDGPSLAEQLRLYQQFVAASKMINRFWSSGRRSIFRIELPRQFKYFLAPVNLTPVGLREGMVRLISRLKPPRPLPESVIDKAISMKEKIDRIRSLLNRREWVGFYELLEGAHNRTEIIISFLALLELVKQKTVALSQENIFSEILIQRV